MKKIFPHNIGQLAILAILFLVNTIVFISYHKNFDFQLEYIISFVLPTSILYLYNSIINKFFFDIGLNNLKYLGIAVPLSLTISLGFLPFVNDFLFQERHMSRNPYADIDVIFPILVMPIVEEMLFRGVIQKGLQQRYGSKYATIIATITFMIVHSPNQYLAAIIFGALFGYIYMKSENLLLTIILHIIVNNVVTLKSYLMFKYEIAILNSKIIEFSCVLVCIPLLLILVKKYESYNG